MMIPQIRIIKDEEILLLAEGKLSWNDLVGRGIIEYIDAAEEDNSLVALRQEDIASEHTHLEYHFYLVF